MTLFSRTIAAALVLGMVVTQTACAPWNENNANVDGFVNEMVVKHQFNEDTLAELFAQAEIKDDILQKISKPSESLPWHKYRKIFLKQPRIAAGVKFWRENRAALAAVEQETGVPAQIIVAIIGVETFYGQHAGNYRVLDALTTLAFAYPPRGSFFRAELENFLVLCRDQNLNSAMPLGSYAGAMGIPQFMPSSYIKYSIDYNKDNIRDIWHNPKDAIASVGNYLGKHGWQKGQTIALQIRDHGQKSVNYSGYLKEDLRNIKFNAPNPNISTPLLSTQRARIIALEQEDGEELWAISENFNVITTYNHSPLYAMAVYQLSLAVANQFSQLSFSSHYEKDNYSGFSLAAGRVYGLSG